MAEATLDVRLERTGRVAILTLDRPPVNAMTGSLDTRELLGDDVKHGARERVRNAAPLRHVQFGRARQARRKPELG